MVDLMKRLVVGLLILLAARTASGQSDSIADAKLAGKYNPTVSRDPFNRTTSSYMQIGDWTGRHREIDSKCADAFGKGNGGDVVTIGIEKLLSEAGDTAFALYVEYRGEDWIYQGEEPAEILTDATPLTLPRAEQAQEARTVERGYEGPVVREGVFYTVTPTVIRAIAGAERVVARVQGSGGGCVVTFSRGTIAAVRQFARHELPP